MLDILFAGFALPSLFVKQLNIVRDFSLTLNGRLLGELTYEAELFLPNHILFRIIYSRHRLINCFCRFTIIKFGTR
jgi:hypothetical protein